MRRGALHSKDTCFQRRSVLRSWLFLALVYCSRSTRANPPSCCVWHLASFLEITHHSRYIFYFYAHKKQLVSSFNNKLDNLNNKRNMKLFLLSTSAMLIVNAAFTGAHDYTNTHMRGPEQASTDVSEVHLLLFTYHVHMI